MNPFIASISKRSVLSKLFALVAIGALAVGSLTAAVAYAYTDYGNNYMGFTVGAVPSTGTLVPGQQVEVYFQNPFPSSDVTPLSACFVNGVDVTSTYQDLTNGLYRLIYTIGENDLSVEPGQLAVDCILFNSTGQIHFDHFTDNNSVAIDAAEDAGGNDGGTGTTTPDGNGTTTPDGTGTTTPDGTGTTTPDGTGTTTPDGTGNGTTTPDGSNGGATTTTASIEAVSANPPFGVLDEGDMLEVYFQAADDVSTLTVSSCSVNGFDVAGSFDNLENGFYKVVYFVSSQSAERASGQIPVNCTFLAQGGQQISVTSFTDGNTTSIDLSNGSGTNNGGNGTTTPDGNNGGTGTTTPDGNGTTTPSIAIAWASVTPSAGTLTDGEQALVYFQESHGMTDLTAGNSCRFNGVEVGSSLENLQTTNNGMYRLTYTVAAGHTDRAAGAIPFVCELENGAGATTTIMALDPNELAIDASAGTTTPGNGTGTTTPDMGTLAVTSIEQIQSVATAGGGYGQGWAWTFRITVPSNEQNVQLKFADWSLSSGTGTISVANNMRVSSQQAATATPVTLTAGDTYSAAMTIAGDMDANVPGRQIEVKVEMQVPSGTANGSYTTNYGVKSFE